MERNRINFAKYCILKYAETLFEQIRTLVHPELEEATNLPHHGLSRAELVVVLYELFSTYCLVAQTESRGLFTPTLGEIEAALDESYEPWEHQKLTFYGFTTGAQELFAELKNLYENKQSL